MLNTHTMVVGKQTNHPIQMTHVVGVIDNVAELEVFANATSSGAVLEATEDDGPRVYYNDRRTTVTILVTIGSYVSWTVKSEAPAEDSNLAG